MSLDAYLSYYAAPAPMSALSPSFDAFLAPLRGLAAGELVPRVAELCQRLIVHPMLMHIYADSADAPRVRMTGASQDATLDPSASTADVRPAPHASLGPQRAAHDTSMRTCGEMCARMAELGYGAEGTAGKLVAVCRHFTLLAVAVFRALGVPARGRCGFAGYFTQQWEDHWIIEVWQDGGWRSVDAQLDPVMLARLRPGLDALDVPREVETRGFITGSAAYEACTRKTDPLPASDFGIENVRGLFFVEGDAILDFWSLNKVELLPWDIDPRAIHGMPFGPERGKLFSRMAGLVAELDATGPMTTKAGTAGGDLEAHLRAFEKIRELFEKEPKAKPGSLDGLLDVRKMGPPPA
ncbi:hypothetical protein DFJ74DRAFT_132062 [Hyaloraphidium curvatum]|nr:hypothetical protein DFJ74DRAFT_132062 [Hyaloraphidium curvatum]